MALAQCHWQCGTVEQPEWTRGSNLIRPSGSSVRASLPQAGLSGQCRHCKRNWPGRALALSGVDTTCAQVRGAASFRSVTVRVTVTDGAVRVAALEARLQRPIMLPRLPPARFATWLKSTDRTVTL
jgi:hypothetical protein